MSHFIESLERRRLMAGGIDASFGSSASGAAFDAPGNSPILVDSAVDSAGRVLLAGGTFHTVAGVGRESVFVARLNGAGELDPRFGIGGIVSGTPRGLSEVDFIVPLADGGYIAVQNTGTAMSNADGSVVASYRADRGLLAPGTFSVAVVGGQVRDDRANENASQLIGRIVIT